jgi:UDP-glucose 4-epimerase
MNGSGRVLITGGLGLVGAALASRLAAHGYQVTVMDDASVGRPEVLDGLAHTQLLPGDVTRPEDFRRLPAGPWEAVYHLAAQANVPVSVADPRADFEVNALGTLNVLEWARGHDVKRLVYASTVAVYQAGTRMPLQEDAALSPSSPYGASKLAGEALVTAYHRTYGLATVVLRLFNVYGQGMTKYVIHDLVRKLIADPEHLEILGTGEQVRDYIHATDAARAFETAARHGDPGAVYNVGSGVPIRIRNLAERIIAVMGLSGVRTTFTGESWSGDIDAWYADISRMQGLGWAPEVPLDEGLRLTVEWLRRHPVVER